MILMKNRKTRFFASLCTMLALAFIFTHIQPFAYAATSNRYAAQGAPANPMAELAIMHTGAPGGHYLDFHLYTRETRLIDTFGTFGTPNADGIVVISVPVIPGAPRSTWPDQTLLNAALGATNIYGQPNLPGYSFWGWFTGATLDASGRHRFVNGIADLRRPLYQDTCAIVYILAALENRNITDAQIIDMFGCLDGGRFNLYGLWALWGDVLDQNAVTPDGLESVRQYLNYTSFGAVVHLNKRAANVVVLLCGTISASDFELIRQYLVYNQFGANIVLGAPPFSLGSNQPCPDTNLARDYRGTVMTASSERLQRRAIYTNNGVRNHSQLIQHSWQADEADYEWLMADFGWVWSFNTVRIYQAGTRTRDYRLEYSINGIAWNTFHTGTHMLVQSPSYYEVRLPNRTQARFVRLVSERSNQPATPIAVFEFEVYFMP